MSIHETLMAEFPVRKSAKQKQAFRAWALREAEQAGYPAKVETCVGNHDNVVIGDPETAKVIFTAHYDTPATILLPNIMLPRNLPLYYLYQIGLVLLLLLLALLVGSAAMALGLPLRAAYWVGWLFYMALLFMMLAGVANPHNANDNTSGVAAVMEIVRRMPEEARNKAAFILFDNEEKGLRGSKGYAKAHPMVKQMSLVVNMDCVGNGETLLVIASKLAAVRPDYAALEEALRAQRRREVRFFSASTSRCASDQKSFACGVAVCACRKKPVIGYYCPRIHTPLDTVCDPENIDCLAERLTAFAAALPGEQA